MNTLTPNEVKVIHKEMKRKKGILANSMIKDAKAQVWGYMLDGKKVSEFQFMQTLGREITGEKAKKIFYWTDKKVIDCFKLIGVKITPHALNAMKLELFQSQNPTTS